MGSDCPPSYISYTVQDTDNDLFVPQSFDTRQKGNGYYYLMVFFIHVKNSATASAEIEILQEAVGVIRPRVQFIDPCEQIEVIPDNDDWVFERLLIQEAGLQSELIDLP